MDPCHENILPKLFNKTLQASVLGFQGDTVVKNPPANAGDARDLGLIPGLGKTSREGNGNLLQYSCLENSMDRRAWWVTKSQTQLSD